MQACVEPENWGLSGWMCQKPWGQDSRSREALFSVDDGQVIFLSSVIVNPCQYQPTELQCFLKTLFHHRVFELPSPGWLELQCLQFAELFQPSFSDGPPSPCAAGATGDHVPPGQHLKRYGVRRGPVAIYMPVSPLAVAAMLACARIGAIPMSSLLASVWGPWLGEDQRW